MLASQINNSFLPSVEVVDALMGVGVGVGVGVVSDSVLPESFGVHKLSKMHTIVTSNDTPMNQR